MTLSGLLVFAAAYGLAVATPGPGIAAVVARALGRGMTGIAPFIAGYVAGDLIWFAVAAGGLAVLAQTFATAFLVVKYAGAAYLLFLAWRLWSTPGSVVDANAPQERGWRLFLTSLSLTLGNPKVIVFFLALLPTIVDLATLTLTDLLTIGAVTAVMIGAIMTLYALAASRARRLFSSPRALTLINRLTGTVMAGAAAVIISR